MIGSTHGITAPYYNPAGIGGLFQETGKKKNQVRMLEFPHFAIAIDEDTYALNSEIAAVPDLNRTANLDQIAAAYLKRSQYVRATILPTLTYRRFLAQYLVDTQLTAIANPENNEEIEIALLETTGPAVGFSFSDNQQRFYFGMYTGFFDKTLTATTMSIAAFRNPETRNEIFKEAKRSYSGSPINTGLIWRFLKRWQSRLSLAVRDLGGTRYRSSDTAESDLVTKESLSLGFAITPTWKKWGLLDVNASLGHLTNSDISIGDGAALSFEYGYGGKTVQDSWISVRAGLQKVGFSFGLGFNLGILGIDLATASRNISTIDGVATTNRFHVNFGIDSAR